MRFWIRELTGWALLVLGLLVFYICLVLLLERPPRIIAVGPLTLIGIVIFRGGIHFLKVAVAARVCLHAQAEIKEQREGPARHEVRRKPARPTKAS